MLRSANHAAGLGRNDSGHHGRRAERRPVARRAAHHRDALGDVAHGADLGLEHDAALVEHQDPVGSADGRQAVGDDDGGAAGHQGFGGQLHIGLGLDVQR